MLVAGARALKNWTIDKWTRARNISHRIRLNWDFCKNAEYSLAPSRLISRIEAAVVFAGYRIDRKRCANPEPNALAEQHLQQRQCRGTFIESVSNPHWQELIIDASFTRFATGLSKDDWSKWKIISAVKKQSKLANVYLNHPSFLCYRNSSLRRLTAAESESRRWNEARKSNS